MSTDARKSQFKKGIDSSSARRRRNDVTINIRKQKKEQGLAKRRNCQLQSFVQAEASASTATAGEAQKMEASLSNLPALVAGRCLAFCSRPVLPASRCFC